MSSNVMRLVATIAASKAIPSNSQNGLVDGIQWLKDAERRNRDLQESFEEAKSYINLIKAASSNPYGDDDEAIAGAILDRLQKS